MRIEGTQLTKRFVYKAIFRDLSFVIEEGQHVAITGPNGSGKSTLLKIISGFLTPSSGLVRYFAEGKEVERNDVWKQIAFTAPYIDLIPAYSVEDFVKFYSRLRPLLPGLTVEEFLKIVRLDKHKDKSIDTLSSGMQQRLKLGIAFYSESKFIILDEPGTNLDEENHNWFISTLQLPQMQGKTCLIASNESKDLVTCTHEVNVSAENK